VEEMTFALEKASSKYIFTVPGSFDIALKAAKKVGEIPSFVVLYL